MAATAGSDHQTSSASSTTDASVNSAPCLGIPKRSSRGICRLECTAFAAELVALGADAILAHGTGPVECCKSIFAGQNNNIDSEMNAGTQHRFTYRKQRECRFGHRLREGGRISEVAPPRRGYANMPPLTKSRSTQVPAKIGRPTKYSIEWAERFCGLIAEGRSVAEICASPDMPSQQSVYTWLRNHEDFLERYARAREAQADKYFQEIVEIADAGTPETVHVARCASTAANSLSRGSPPKNTATT